MAFLGKLPRARPSHIGYVTQRAQVFYLKTKSEIQYERNIGAQTKYLIRKSPNGIPDKTAARGPRLLATLSNAIRFYGLKTKSNIQYERTK